MEKHIRCLSLVSTHEHMCACAYTCTHTHTHTNSSVSDLGFNPRDRQKTLKGGKKYFLAVSRRCSRKDSTITSPGGSCTRPASHSQCLYDSSQNSITPVPVNPVPSFWPPWAPDMHVVHRHPCRQNTHSHKKMKQKQKT